MQNGAEFVNEAVKGGAKNLIFDMSEITYVSSTGIGTFTGFLKNVKPMGGNLVLVGMAKRVLEVFSLLGFVNFFDRTDTVDEALDLFPAEAVTSDIPYGKMESIVDSIDGMGKYIAKEKQHGFYGELFGLMRQIQELKSN